MAVSSVTFGKGRGVTGACEMNLLELIAGKAALPWIAEQIGP